MCEQHIEKCILLFYPCDMARNRTDYLIGVLKKAGFLGKGQEISLFSVKEYELNSMKTLMLTTFRNITYNIKFSPENVLV